MREMLLSKWELLLTMLSVDSIRNVAATLAFDTMKYYNGNVSTNPVVSRDI